MADSMLGKILRALMFKRDVNTCQLAREINLPQQTVQRIVSGVSPNPHQKNLKPIADFFAISVAQLRGESPLPDSMLSLEVKSNVQQITKAPLLPWNQVINYLDGENVTIDEYVSTDRVLTPKTFAINLPDSSMEPFFPKDSLLILSPDKETKDRCFALVKTNEGSTLIFRQVIIDGEHKYLKPLNPDLSMFPMRLLQSDELILGVMIEFRCRYDDF
jgi:SOS-response transcriptional repressor LexA